MTFRSLLLFFGLALLLSASDCIPTDDDDMSDDDDVSDDDDMSDDDDDVTPPAETVVSGEVIAVDRDTGVELSPADFAERAGGLIVYALPDASDLSEILAKDTLEGPGPYEMTVTDHLGPIDVVVVADEDSDHFIENSDIARAYAFNPLAAAGEPLEDVDLVIDLPPRGGSDCSPRDTTISGDVILDGLPDGPIGVSTNSANLAWGPLHHQLLEGAGPYSIVECSSRGSVAMLGYLDLDGNGYFEPSDPIGEAGANPVQVDLGDVSGIQITIPDGVSSPPSPPAYVALTGTVAYDSFTTGDILVYAGHATTDSYVF
ncbi:MAG: hypothetical protein GY898_27290, partial [Proteobacteria bacterium]|nr:hypothetical protein [Pseudomonadota bacterium]